MGVSYEQDGEVRIIVIDRPDRANAIDLDAARRLSETFDEAERDDATRTVVLTGAGDRVFSAGMDLGAVRDGQAAAINGVHGGFAGIVRREFPKPLIAAVNGAAMGGGFEIVLACDLVVAARNARFGLPEVTRGLLAASGGAVRLPLRLPAALALELLLVGEPIDAERGHELGLVNAVVPEGGAREAATNLAHRIGANAPLAVRVAKRVARVALTAGEDEAWMLNGELAASVAGSADAAEGARAASERRPPQWSGR